MLNLLLSLRHFLWILCYLLSYSKCLNIPANQTGGVAGGGGGLMRPPRAAESKGRQRGRLN